jgi:hypothetical protein
MFVEEFSLNAAEVFQPPVSPDTVTPPLPSLGSLLGAGASLFLASDLFPASSVKRGNRLEHAPLNVLSSVQSATYSGERLDQFDLDVFLGCVIKDIRKEKPARRPMRDFLRTLGRRPTPSGLALLEASLFRLASARIELADQRFGCCVQLVESVLVDREQGVCRVKAAPEAVAALGETGRLEELAKLRLSLGQRLMAKWLAGLITVLGGESCQLDLNRLRGLCGMHSSSMVFFPDRALAALSTLADMGYIHSTHRSPNGRVLIVRRTGRNVTSECQLVW